MVILHGALAGRTQPRVTHDIDLLFDIRAQVQALRRAVALLESLGYVVDGMSPDLLAHRYRRGDGMLVDLLAPDNVGPRADLTTSPPGRTIEVPGGTRALANRIALDATYQDLRVRLYIPSLGQALVGKVRAFTVEAHERHLEDVAFLCSLVDDPDEILGQFGRIGSGERFTRARALDDEDHRAWRQLGAYAEGGHLAWRMLRNAP